MLMKNMDQSTHLTILPVTKIKYYDKPHKKLRSKQEICCPKINENLDQNTHLPLPSSIYNYDKPTKTEDLLSQT